ncbi:MAG: cysteine desulfurase [Clostridia bacterium]|nr:cysteine desulfurase [Clostridia bacterium]
MIYLDNAATTKPFDEVLKTFNEVNTTNFFNPSSSYSSAFNLYKKISEARKMFIKFLHGDEENDNIIFTCGATESNNLAIFGSATNKNMTYLFSSGEHPSVYNCAKELLQRGFDVKFIPLQKNGQIDYEELEKLMTEKVCFVSTMFVSNEMGAVNDLARIRKIIDNKNKNAIFHVDAVQGFGKLALNLKKFGVNLCSISAHKIGGLKGVGALYISSNTNIKNVVFGGNQEFTLRSGTVNAGGILSFLKATEIAFENKDKNYENALKLKNILVENLKKIEKRKIIVVSDDFCSPYVVSLIFENSRGENILRFLDTKGICVSTGSACSSNKVGNRILESMKYSKQQIMGALRVSFGFENSERDIEILVKNIIECLKLLNI